RLVFRELATGSDGRGVGAVDGEDLFEGVECVGEVAGFGDDVEVVLVSATRHCDVQPATGRRGAGPGEADIDGVGLPAMLGGCVPQPGVLARVVVGHRPPSGVVGAFDEQAAAGAGGDDPLLPVADG